MDRKTCNRSHIKKHIRDIYNKYTECKKVISKEVKNVTMRIKVIYQINEKYTWRKIEINFYKKILNIYILKNYLDPMLN